MEAHIRNLHTLVLVCCVVLISMCKRTVVVAAESPSLGFLNNELVAWIGPPALARGAFRFLDTPQKREGSWTTIVDRGQKILRFFSEAGEN